MHLCPGMDGQRQQQARACKHKRAHAHTPAQVGRKGGKKSTKAAAGKKPVRAAVPRPREEMKMVSRLPPIADPASIPSPHAGHPFRPPAAAAGAVCE